MSLDDQKTVKTLLEQPRIAKVVLAMYEGLAQSCEELANQSPRTPNLEARLQTYERLYKVRVGIDRADRDVLRQEADKRIREELSSEVGS
jgi:hypothetical protein